MGFRISLRRFGVHNLSDDQLDSLFDSLLNEDQADQRVIYQQHFEELITCLENMDDSSDDNQDMQLRSILMDEIHSILLYEIHSKGSNTSHTIAATAGPYQPVLYESEFMERSYHPWIPTQSILDEYKEQITSLKQQLSDAMETIKNTVRFNDVITKEQEHVITALIAQEERQEVQDIFDAVIDDAQMDRIQSSLERIAPMNPSEWTLEDCCDWLTMQGMGEWVDTFKVHEVTGSKLLNDDSFVHSLQSHNRSATILFDKLDDLRLAAPQIYDRNGCTPSSDEDSQDTVALDECQEALETIRIDDERVTPNGFAVDPDLNSTPQTLVRSTKEVERLHAEIEQLEMSKLALITSTALEMQRLRDIIKEYTRCPQ